ncbi:type 1 periplasmic-binding domain-containing protein [Streptomyces millisiae]|uniref:Uncharacterized protein n=1 Tax=Streptomyces millisiae TaxID=3075542 RepID=A0ABU2LPF4_9ACTN|nr:hypothetical protein [Streptomyces sp. DSM 44918]MDT0319128.1 hypothetical protein [Streptomyces sp. DSM 44918]
MVEISSSRHARAATRTVRRFAEAHGGAGGQIAYLGARGYRLVLVGADGEWGDVVAARRETLEEAARAAGVEVREALDGELAARLRTGPREWRRMAGIQIG